MNRRLLTGLLLVCATFVIGCFGTSDDAGAGEVVVYVAHDQDYSEPILKLFERDTGIRVRPVYDTETTKTVGLVNKLISEKSNPQADVFWNNEVSRSIMLKKEGILKAYKSPNSEKISGIFKDPDGYWTGFAARARVILYNTEKVPADAAPTSINDLLLPKWRGKFCMANPLFGTAGSHVSALFVLWGREKAENYFIGLRDNGLAIVESNGMVRDQVVSGEYWAGITDTDDAYDAVSDGKPVKMVFPDQEGFGTLIIPNSVMLIDGAPNSQNGKILIDYLLSVKVEAELAKSKAMQMPLGENVPVPDYVPAFEELTPMDVDQYQIADMMEESQMFVQERLLD